MMSLSAWLNSLEQRRDRREVHLEFETFVVKLLEHLAISEGKSFDIQPSVIDGQVSRPLRSGNSQAPEIRINAVAADGIMDLKGPTLVAARFYRAPDLTDSRIAVEALLRVAQTVRAKGVLLIVSGQLATADKERMMPTRSGEISIEIWDAVDLGALSARFSDYTASLIPHLASIAVGAVIEQGLKDPIAGWIEKRAKHIANVQQAFRQNDLVLFLGAGVSAASGVPTWETLISRLLVSMIERKLPASLPLSDDDRAVIATALKNLHGSSPLLEARYVRAGLGSMFTDTLAELLYGFKQPIANAPLLDALARLCIPKRSGPGLRAVVTYNFDDLLEHRLADLGVPHRPVYRDDDIPGQDELGVHHVHGFIPRDTSAHGDLASTLLIFSEEGYHKLFGEPYTWSNIVQINFLRETTCLFIGLSVTDPNLRRLLDIAAAKHRDPKHFVILKRVSPQDMADSKRGSGILREDLARAFISAHHELQETAFGELGLNIIWVEDYAEIPEFINKIRNV